MLDAGMEMELGIDANFGKIHSPMAVFRAYDKAIDRQDLSSQWNFGYNNYFDFTFNIPPVNSPRTITRQTFGFSASSSPRPQSAGRRLSPFSEFAGLEVIDTRPDFQLRTICHILSFSSCSSSRV